MSSTNPRMNLSELVVWNLLWHRHPTKRGRDGVSGKFKQSLDKKKRGLVFCAKLGTKQGQLLQPFLHARDDGRLGENGKWGITAVPCWASDTA